MYFEGNTHSTFTSDLGIYKATNQEKSLKLWILTGQCEKCKHLKMTHQ